MKCLILFSVMLVSSSLGAMAQQPTPTVPRPIPDKPPLSPRDPESFPQDFLQMGTLTGTVIFRGAAVAGATVTAINKRTGERASSSTSADGSFTISRLPPGKYSLTINLAGFMTKTLDELEIKWSGTSAVRINMDDDVPVSPPVTKPGSGNSGRSQGGLTHSLPSYSPRTVEASEESFKDDLELTKWLETKKVEGRRLLSIIPLKDKVSIFVLEVELKVTKKKSTYTYNVLSVNESIKADRLEERLNQKSGQTLLGVHQLTEDSYLMVFYAKQ